MNTQKVFKHSFIKEKLKSKPQSKNSPQDEAGDEALSQDFFCDEELVDNNENIMSLERRIKLLESQSNHLMYFIYFMYENFPELVKKIIPVQKMYGLFMADRTNLRQEEQPIRTKPTSAKSKIHVTPREYEILLLLAEGFCAKEIATKLYISESTVVTHKKNLKEKFEARNTVELISKAVKWTEKNT